MKRWKQISAFCLAAVLSASGTTAAWAGSPEFARTAEEWAQLRDNTMEYGELAGLIREYNVTVQTNQLDLSDKKNDDLVTRDEYAQYYRDAADDARSAIAGDDDTAVADAGLAVAARQAEEQADKNTMDLNVYKLTYDQAEANLVASAQTAMISYFQQQYQLESAKSSLELLNAVYDSSVVRKNAGMATQVDVLTALENVQNAQTSVDKLTASIEETRQKLCIMLGWKYNDTPDIKEIPAVNMDKIAAMNPETDQEAALTNNYTLNINKKKLENATADVTKQTLATTISSNEQNIGTDLSNNYQSVLHAKASYDQAVAEYNLEVKNMAAADRKNQVGTISRLEYQKQKNAYETKSIAVKTAELTLFQAVQTYENAVGGLASGG